jgi:hypothetical protein
MFKVVAVAAGEAFGACLDARPGMAGVSVNPLDPGAAIAWPLPVNASNPAQISAKDASALAGSAGWG